jgi:23S rRNA pseudouridine2605 synthase
VTHPRLVNRRPGQVRLDRALSKRGHSSRKKALELILSGLVQVDGRTVTDPGTWVVPERVKLTICGRPARRPVPVAMAFHKPRGVVTTRFDPRGRPTVYGLLPADAPWMVPVGRLDLATSGLLLFTNSTRLAHWLTDPENGVLRVYAVTVRGELDETALAKVKMGVFDQGELLKPTRLTVRKRSGRETHLFVWLTEGKNREIRRLFALCGFAVTRLLRTGFGGILLGELKPGEWRPITRDELALAFPGAPIW